MDYFSYLCTIIHIYNIRKDNMEQNKNMIAVAYELHDAAAADNSLIEKTEEGRPFVFLTSCGMVLDDFEKAIAPLAKGESFDFTLAPDRAYGEYVDERVVDLDKQLFFVDGKFDSDHIQVGSVVPLQNDNGDRFMGSVVEIGDDKVTIDLNHPLAGKTLNFKGRVLEKREASNQEIQNLVNYLSGEGGCGCGCDDCGGGCGDHDCGGHDHGHGCGCGHCH